MSSHSPTTLDISSPLSSQIHPLLHKLFLKRGKTEQDIQDFLSWDLKQLPLFSDIPDLLKAAQRISAAILRRESIGVFGDYDVDGTTSCALFFHFFQLLEISAEILQPGRFKEGYGIHPPSIEEAVEKGIKLLITVDCGITATEASIKARELGLDLIITDHHQDILPELPPAYAIVNPSRRDGFQEELKSLAGVGVAFALCIEIKKILFEEAKISLPSLYFLLPFVAIGTLADLAPLTPCNLKLIRHGLKALQKTELAGLQSFLKEEEKALDLLSGEKISFEIGSLLNAKGRMDHPEMSFKLLISKNFQESQTILQHLQACNTQRKFIQSQIVAAAQKQILLEKNSQNLPPIAIAFDKEWHEGVIGIVASKLVELFGIPALVFTYNEHTHLLKGSGRTAGKLNLFELMNQYAHLFEKFGGHHSACGLSLQPSNLPILKNSLYSILESIPKEKRTQSFFHDLELSPQYITVDFIKHIERLGPYGQGHPTPQFLISQLILKDFKILKKIHVKWIFECAGRFYEGISFSYFQSPSSIFPQEFLNRPLKIIATLGLNRFNNNCLPQLFIKNISTFS